LVGIDHFQVFDGMLVLTMPHIGGQDRQCLLGRSLPGFDLQKGVDSERMPQAVYGRGAKVGAADNMPYLFNTDGSDGLVKDQADPFWSEATVPGPGQKIRVVSIIHQVATHIQVVLQLGVYRSAPVSAPVSGGPFCHGTGAARPLFIVLSV
jgi:hypothetical protein